MAINQQNVSDKMSEFSSKKILSTKNHQAVGIDGKSHQSLTGGSLETDNIELKQIIFLSNFVFGILLGIFFLFYSILKMSMSFFLMSIILILVGISSGVYIEIQNRREIKAKSKCGDGNSIIDAGLL